MIVRTLNFNTQIELEQRGYNYEIPRYLRDGSIDMNYLLKDFQAFWRENADIWKEKYDYKEAAPQLILQAFLQRVLNGGGQIVREMAAATGRVDLCVIYNGKKYPIELKIRRGARTYDEGVRQITSYMDTLGCDTGWLLIFDENKTTAPSERLFIKTETINNKTINVFGL